MPAVQGVTTARAGWSAVTDLVPAAIPAVAYNAKLLQPRGIKRVDGQSHVGVVDIARRDELDRGPWLGDEAIDRIVVVPLTTSVEPLRSSSLVIR